MQVQLVLNTDSIRTRTACIIGFGMRFAGKFPWWQLVRSGLVLQLVPSSLLEYAAHVAATHPATT